MKPKYLDKNPCFSCGTGYGDCASYALHSLKCCKDCKHPNPLVWTEEDRAEMKAIMDERKNNFPQRLDEKYSAYRDIPGYGRIRSLCLAFVYACLSRSRDYVVDRKNK